MTCLDEATESDDENSDDDTASITSNDDAVATAAQDTAAVNDDCCEVCVVAERDTHRVGATWPPVFLWVVR